MYQELAHSTILFVEGTATIERENLKTATESIQKTLQVCHANRRKSAFSESITKRLGKNKIAVFKQYTEEQAHAELCFAEGLLQFAFLNLLKDDNFTSLLRSSLKIRQCYKCYRVCWGILKHREWADGISKSAFESGVRLGVGAFNMMISLLPERVLKLLEFVGFSGDRHFGLSQLRLGAAMVESLRAPLCSLLLLVYDLYATQMLGDTVASVAFEKPEQIYEAKELLNYWQQIYPKSAIFQLLQGRYNAITGDIQQAIEIFKQSIELPLDWAQYRHMCYWELLWCYALRSDWISAVEFVEKLACESQWSQASYRYMKAAFLIQHLDDLRNEPPDQQKAVTPKNNYGLYKNREEIYEHLDKLLEEIPKLMQRFAGKSLPLEKLALRKSKRYFSQDRKLTLPALELMFIWNNFKMVQCQQESVVSFQLICENKINELRQHQSEYKNYYDEYSLAMLLKGVCSRCRNQLDQARTCYEEVMRMKKNINLDTYLLPFCEMELCHLAFDEGDLQKSMDHLKQALSYKKYSLESRLHFRMHEMQTRLNELTGKKKLKNKKLDDNSLSNSPSLSSLPPMSNTTGKHPVPLDSESDNGSMNKSMFPEFDDDLIDIDGISSSEESTVNLDP